jgi:hypothetical protein
MTANFSWIIRDKLAGAALPGGSEYGLDRALEQDLADLHSQGIRCLVSLTDSASNLGPPCRSTGLIWHFYPITEFGIPGSIESLDTLITAIIGHMDRRQPVCVHCYAGIGRTGLVLCCTVGKYFHLSPSKAISTVRSVRSALETRDQERFVHRFLESS